VGAGGQSCKGYLIDPIENHTACSLKKTVLVLVSGVVFEKLRVLDVLENIYLPFQSPVRSE
jgi:hypothetical protein